MLTQTKLEILIEKILPHALRSGLEFPHIHFELVDTADIHALASYHGLPVRYAHWSFGKNFGRILVLNMSFQCLSQSGAPHPQTFQSRFVP